MNSKLKISKNSKQLKLEFNDVINKPLDTMLIQQAKIIRLNPRKELYTKILDRK